MNVTYMDLVRRLRAIAEELKRAHSPLLAMRVQALARDLELKYG